MIAQQEYKQRRQKIAASLQPNTVAIVSASQEVLRNGDAHYRFRQNSNFYYLTGFNEPEALLLISKEGSLLFNRVRNRDEEIWTGKRLGQDGACSVLNMDNAYPITSLHDELPKLLAGKTAVYYSFGIDHQAEKELQKALTLLRSMQRKGIQVPKNLIDLEPIISEMRLFKSEAELKLMRKAASISVEAHKKAMQLAPQVEFEYELEAELLYTFARLGCRSVAYDPIVGSGENTCILHYTDNDQPLKDLILIDAGGEYQNYASDITRTFPKNGQFSAEQRTIYSLVLKAQKAGIACIKPGVLWVTIQETMVEVLTKGLCELGILTGTVEDNINNGTYRRFYMHNSGHWLGLDVHDCGVYKIDNAWRPLEAGMVLTVEPGLYIAADSDGVDKKWWNIGVRIEDDILVTETGYENLTAELPVEIDDIEALIRG